MTPYVLRSEDRITQQEERFWRIAKEIVVDLPHGIDGQEVRCHELARVVASYLDLPYQDGHYGFVEHTWIWTQPLEDELQRWRLPNILDVYVPGQLPQVQLIHTSVHLPLPYIWGPPREDIREGVVTKLHQVLEETSTKLRCNHVFNGLRCTQEKNHSTLHVYSTKK